MKTNNYIIRKYGNVLSIFKINFFLLQGFARYSTDARWHVPHFEKMLYDQAQLVVAYSYAFQATQDSKFKAIVEDILTYVNRDLSHPLGGFFRYNIHIKLIFCINKFSTYLYDKKNFFEFLNFLVLKMLTPNLTQTQIIK